MKTSKALSFLVVAQGSGGHVFPAIAFCQEFSSKYPLTHKITFVTSTKAKFAGQGQVSIPEEFRPLFLPVQRTPIGIFRLVIESLKIVARERPDIVFGFGGYFTVPFIFWAKLLGKKTILHEQNVIPGRANMFLRGMVDRIIVSFEESKIYFKANPRKIAWARFPLKANLCRIPKKEALDQLGLKDGLLTVLVVGGSQGAHALNDKILEALKENKNCRQLQIIHLTGHKDFQEVQARYRELPVVSRVFAFLEEMQVAYSASDLMIGRSGAGCIAEILKFALPSVLVPYPFAGAHQIENARVLAKRGAALLLEEDKMTGALLSGLLDIFIEDTMRRKTMATILEAIESEGQKITLSEAVFL